MKLIACAILSVGLCFYVVYRKHLGLDFDWVASLISFIAALIVIFSSNK